MEILITITDYGKNSEAAELVKNQNGDCNEPFYHYRTIIYIIIIIWGINKTQ